MKNIKTNQLVPNQNTINLYGITEDVKLTLSISLLGILEPLIVFPLEDSATQHYQIVSGNRRLSSAIELGIETVPAIIIDETDLSDLLVMSHNEYRTKLPSHIIREYRAYNEAHNLSQGKKDAASKKAVDVRNQIFQDVSKSTLDRLVQVDSLAKRLSTTEKEYKDRLEQLDKSRNVGGFLKSLQTEIKERNNRKRTEGLKLVEYNNSVIYKKSSEFMTELGDESVQTIICSPPYWQMRDYKIGDDQLGHQKTLDEFTTKLTNHFNDAKRVLKSKGSLFVNLADRKSDGKLVPLVFSFAQKMISQGWLWVDNITWLKRNCQYTNTKSSMCVHENILHFVKSTHYYYSLDWMRTSQIVNGGILVASGTKNVKFKSAWDFRHPFVTTNTPNNHWLKVACEKEGISLTHSATFPREIPLMAILSTSSEGDTIVDMFNGSGTTAQAVEEVGGGRKYVGYELNETYLAITKCRLENYEKVDESAMKLAS
jgi:ParB/RepB/Spo0J family partition protein